LLTTEGLINNNVSAYREKVSEQALKCNDNNLNIRKTNKLIVDFRKQMREHDPIHSNGTGVERVTRFKFLSVHISMHMRTHTHITTAATRLLLYCPVYTLPPFPNTHVNIGL
jgi:calcineurin-like phosphoesterase